MVSSSYVSNSSGFALWGTILVSSVSVLADDPALCILMGFIESLETCFLLLAATDKHYGNVMLREYYFSVPLMIFYSLTL